MNTSRVATLLSLLPSSLDRLWTLEEMARAAGASESQLRKDFVSVTGLPPTQYLKLLRMAAAKEMLTTTRRSVKDVASAVGLRDVSHFVRAFRDCHGCAPSEVRCVAPPTAEMN